MKVKTPFERGESFARTGLCIQNNPYLREANPTSHAEFILGYNNHQRRTAGVNVQEVSSNLLPEVPEPPKSPVTEINQSKKALKVTNKTMLNDIDIDTLNTQQLLRLVRGEVLKYMPNHVNEAALVLLNRIKSRVAS